MVVVVNGVVVVLNHSVVVLCCVILVLNHGVVVLVVVCAIPVVVVGLDYYQISQAQPCCHFSWWLLAAWILGQLAVADMAMTVVPGGIASSVVVAMAVVLGGVAGSSIERVPTTRLPVITMRTWECVVRLSIVAL